jgi:hypothetical protein
VASFYWLQHREAQERNCHSLGPSVALIVAPRAGRACEPSPIPILIMSLAVAPPRAPSIDPALRAFLVECLDTSCLDTADGNEDGDGDDVARRPCAFAGLDLPRALSFDEADVDLSGICAWLEGDVVATDGSFLASKTTLASPSSKRRARDLGSLDDPRLGDKRGRRGAPATPPRYDDDILFASLSDPLGGDRTDPDPSNGRDNSNSDNSNSDDSNSGPKEARLRRNRASAALSRQRKRTELVHLRQRCRELERANRHFQYVAQCASHENAALRRRLAEIGGVAGGAPVPMSADVAVVPVTHLPIPRMRAQIKTCEAGGLGRDLQRTRTAEGTSAGVTTSGVDDATYTLCDMPRVESRRRRGAAWRSNHGMERNHGTERSVCRPRRVRRGRRRYVKTRDEAARDLRDSSPGCAAPRRVTRADELPAVPSTGRDTRHPSSHRTLSAVLSGLTLAVPYV